MKRPRHFGLALGVVTALACGGAIDDLVFGALTEYYWDMSGWTITQYTHGTGSAIVQQQAGGSHSPLVNVNWGVFPAADNVSESWVVGLQHAHTYNITVPVVNVIINFEGQRALDGGGTVEIAAVIHQGGKIYVSDRRFHPAATAQALHAAAQQASDFDEWDPATRTFNTASHPTLSSGSVQMGFWAHARHASPSSMTESANFDELVLTFDLS